MWILSLKFFFFSSSFHHAPIHFTLLHLCCFHLFHVTFLISLFLLNQRYLHTLLPLNIYTSSTSLNWPFDHSVLPINISLHVIFFPLSLSHSGTTSTGRGTTSWAWPGSPKTSWRRYPTSSSPTWGPAGSSHRQRHLPTRRQGSPSKPRYEEPGGERFGSQGLAELNAQNTSISPKPLSMPHHRGSQWSFLSSGSCMSGQESVAFEDRKSQWESVYFHCQAFLLLSGIFFFLPGKPGQALDRVWMRVWIQAGKKRSTEERKRRSNEGQLLGHIVKRMSPDKTKESLDLIWTFSVNNWTFSVSFSLSLSNSLIVYSKC